MNQQEIVLWNQLVRCAVKAGRLPDPDLVDVEGGLEWYPDTLAMWFNDSSKAGMEEELDYCEIVYNTVNR